MRSVLISLIKKQLTTYHQPALVEEFIIGRELLVYLLEIDRDVMVLPIEEVIFESQNPLAFQTYGCKWDENYSDYKTSDVVVANLTNKENIIIKNVCVDTFKKLGFRGYARFDIRLKNNIPYILEANANPSVYDSSEEIKDADEEVIPGIRFSDYIYAIVQSALYHYAHGWNI